jgi:hypothetical protein
VTKARINMPEMKDAVAPGASFRTEGPARERRRARDQGGDRSRLASAGNRASLRRAEGQLRRVLFEQTAGMFPELVTRPISTSSCRRSAA